MSDESLELVNRLAGGDAAAIEPLLERHLPGLRAWVRLHGRALRAQESSSDLCQSVCRDVLENLGRFQYGGEGAFRHWLYTTATRKIRNRQKYWLAQKRDAGRDVPMVGPARSGSDEHLMDAYASICSPSEDAIAREEIERVEAAFARLSDDHRDVILMARVAGLSHAEIAERMDRKEGAVRALLFRALAQLASLMGPE
jgi:RNA polymerase sigma-70 factor (ECF subfamily)